MSNYAWVCFNCHVAVRRSGTSKDVRCPVCAQPCECLGYKIPVPPKSKPKEWERLRQEFYRSKGEPNTKHEQYRVRRIEDLEQEMAKLSPMPENAGHLEAFEEVRRRIDRKIASASSALMNNTKWRKLLTVLREITPHIKWKFIKDERIFTAEIPGDCDLYEDGFGDVLPYPYGRYKEIDWILVPATYADPRSDEKRLLPAKKNNLDHIENVLRAAGKFPLRRSAEGIKIIGYEWQ